MVDSKEQEKRRISRERPFKEENVGCNGGEIKILAQLPQFVLLLL